MRSGLPRRLVEWLRRRMFPARGVQRGGNEVAQELASEFTTEELQEFLEGDLHPAEADPAFKEKLRQELWQIVQQRYGRARDERLD